eukprot:3602825-Lingulodinium_polyedra.AAC.1
MVDAFLFGGSRAGSWQRVLRAVCLCQLSARGGVHHPRVFCQQHRGAGKGFSDAPRRRPAAVVSK